MERKKEHQIQPKDLELNEWEFRLLMGEAWEHRQLFLDSIFCLCASEEKTLVEFKIYLNTLNDLVLRGKCSACGELAARYIEIGEDPEKFKAGEHLRNARKG